MIRVLNTNLVTDATSACAIERFDRPPHLRSDAVVLSVIKSTPEQVAARKRTDRRFVACLVILALCAAPFIWS